MKTVVKSDLEEVTTDQVVWLDYTKDTDSEIDYYHGVLAENSDDGVEILLTKNIKDSLEKETLEDENWQFSSEESLLQAAKEQFNQHFPGAKVLMIGVPECCPQKVLVGPENFKRVINDLHKEFNEKYKEFKKKEKEVDIILKQWEEIWPHYGVTVSSPVSSPVQISLKNGIHEHACSCGKVVVFKVSDAS